MSMQHETTLLAVTPHCQATTSISLTMTSESGLDLKLLHHLLQEMVETTANGPMENAEAMALMQAKTLEVVFHELLRKAMADPSSLRFGFLLRMALKAQGQSTRALETLAMLRKPVVFAEQMNLAQQQVVNNAAPAVSQSKRRQDRRKLRPKTVRLAKKQKPQPDHADE